MDLLIWRISFPDPEWYFTVGALVKVVVVIYCKDTKWDKMTSPTTRNDMDEIMVVLNENKDKDRHHAAQM